jgi:S-(hydroxymethyl)glutathione dehydrogenase/alcohol dehydrogenase
VNAGGCTTFQRHTVASENRLTLVPPSLPLEIAAMLGCPTPTGMGAALNVAGVRAGDTVAVFGTGGIGLNASMAAAFSGASILIGVDPSPDRRALAQRFGATHTIDPGQTDPVSEIKKIVPAGVDISIEATGITAVMQQAVSATRSQGGRAIIVGNAQYGSILEIDPVGVFNQGKSLMGTWGGDSVPDRDYGRFGRILASGRFPVRELLSKPYSLTEINQALADLSQGKVGRPLIDMALT